MSDPTEETYYHELLIQLATAYLAATEAGADLDSVDVTIRPVARSWLYPVPPDPETSRLVSGAIEALAALPTQPPSVEAMWTVSVASQSALGHSPSLLAGDRVSLSWLEYDGHDDECIRGSSLDPDSGRTTLDMGRLSHGRAILRPVLVSDSSATVLHTSRVEGDTGVWMSGGSESTKLAAGSINPDAVVDSSGSSHVVYQEWVAGAYQISYMVLDGSVVKERTQLTSDLETNHWDPAVAVGPDGTVWVCYSKFERGRYGMAIMRRSPGQAWDGELSLTVNPKLHALHPTIAASDTGVYIAYDEVDVPDHGSSGATAYRASDAVGSDARVFPEDAINATIRILRHDAGAWEQADGPVGRGSTQHHGAACYPKVAVSDDGTVWIGFRARRALPLRHHFYQAMIAHTNPSGGWSTTAIPNSAGPASEVDVATIGNDAIVAWHTDDRALKDIKTIRQNLEGRSPFATVYGGNPGQSSEPGRAAWDQGRGAGAVVVARLRPVDVGRPLTKPYQASDPHMPTNVEDVVADRVRYGDTEMSLFWGDLHRHSNISRCAAGLDIDLIDHYRFAHDIAGYDFWAMTDHSEHTSQFRWFQLQKIANAHLIPGEHVPLIGFEWTSFVHGHMNVIYPGDAGPIYSASDPATETPPQLWRALGDLEALTIPHHPASVHYPTNWDEFDERFVRVVEVFQAATGSYESNWCFRQSPESVVPESTVRGALDRGYKVGMIASTDHRYGASYAGVYATGLSRREVWDAIYNRRCFAATTRGIIPSLVVGGQPMGSTVDSGKTAVQFGARSTPGRNLSHVILLKNGEVVRHLSGVEELDAAVGVDVRWESQSGGRRTWSGVAELSPGAHFVETEYLSPQVISLEERRLEWTSAFREWFGSQRNPPGMGGLGFTVAGDPGAVLSVQAGALRVSSKLQSIDSVLSAHDQSGSMMVRRGIGGLSTLNRNDVTEEVVLQLEPTDYVYVLAIRTDGEAAWSSPVWVE